MPLLVPAGARKSHLSSKSAKDVVVCSSPCWPESTEITPSATCQLASLPGCQPKVVSPSNNRIQPSSSSLSVNVLGASAPRAAVSNNNTIDNDSTQRIMAAHFPQSCKSPAGRSDSNTPAHRSPQCRGRRLRTLDFQPDFADQAAGLAGAVAAGRAVVVGFGRQGDLDFQHVVQAEQGGDVVRAAAAPVDSSAKG